MAELNNENNLESQGFDFREGEVNPETGLTYDYLNELYKITTPLQIASSDQEIVDGFKNQPLQHYEDRYPGYINVVTDQNREAVQEINSLIDEVNEMIDVRTLSKSRLQEIVARITKLIRDR